MKETQGTLSKCSSESNQKGRKWPVKIQMKQTSEHEIDGDGYLPRAFLLPHFIPCPCQIRQPHTWITVLGSKLRENEQQVVILLNPKNGRIWKQCAVFCTCKLLSMFFALFLGRWGSLVPFMAMKSSSFSFLERERWILGHSK